jgi:hypothetical protein
MPYGSHNETAIRWKNEIEAPNGTVGRRRRQISLSVRVKRNKMRQAKAFKHGILIFSLEQTRVGILVVDTNEEASICPRSLVYSVDTLRLA